VPPQGDRRAELQSAATHAETNDRYARLNEHVRDTASSQQRDHDRTISMRTMLDEPTQHQFRTARFESRDQVHDVAATRLTHGSAAIEGPLMA
jgi:hypothetical protein